MKPSRIGSSVDSWLQSEGTYEQTSSRAIKRVLARQLQAAMEAQQVSKVEMARRMGSSRSALDRLLDPNNESVTLSTLTKAAAAVGLQVRLELV
ncbi:MAG: helix-turn-helix transcriptional regulator [Vicinamibacterales bacterium]